MRNGEGTTLKHFCDSYLFHESFLKKGTSNENPSLFKKVLDFNAMFGFKLTLVSSPTVKPHGLN